MMLKSKKAIKNDGKHNIRGPWVVNLFIDLMKNFV